MNNVPTIVPKTIKPTEWKSRKTMNSSGRDRIITTVAQLTEELKKLRVDFDRKENELKTIIENLEKKNIQNTKFTIDRFKHNEAHFKFYTGL